MPTLKKNRMDRSDFNNTWLLHPSIGSIGIVKFSSLSNVYIGDFNFKCSKSTRQKNIKIPIYFAVPSNL